MKDSILILDFGSQYTQLIARRIRELHVYCEILPFDTTIPELQAKQPKAIILSGGPSSVYETQAPHCSSELFQLGIPVLGICYGMQIMAYLLGGEVKSLAQREYGSTAITIHSNKNLFSGISGTMPVWMSHGDEVVKVPEGFVVSAKVGNTVAAIECPEQNLYAVQFHPEVVHTPEGKEILKNFLFQIAKADATWTLGNFIKNSIESIKEQVGEGHAVCGLSGGIDSAVAAVLVSKAIGDRLTCLFIDNGLLRIGEFEQVLKSFCNSMSLNVIGINAKEQFLAALTNVIDPEQKRKIIGREFIEIFQEKAEHIGQIEYLVQGTLYPDVIESISVKGPAATIKSHHNVGGLPDTLHLKLIEPLRELFKDEVRILGKELGMPDDIINRQPFPGPGLAIRILGEVTSERIVLLQKADKIVEEEIQHAGLYESLWQSFAVLLPIKTVGVMGDERTYENVAAIRAVESQDGMTADWARLPYEILQRISSRIISEVRGINRVVYDISSKPPSTIEWE